MTIYDDDDSEFEESDDGGDLVVSIFGILLLTMLVNRMILSKFRCFSKDLRWEQEGKYQDKTHIVNLNYTFYVISTIMVHLPWHAMSPSPRRSLEQVIKEVGHCQQQVFLFDISVASTRSRSHPLVDRFTSTKSNVRIGSISLCEIWNREYMKYEYDTNMNMKPCDSDAKKTKILAWNRKSSIYQRLNPKWLALSGHLLCYSPQSVWAVEK